MGIVLSLARQDLISLHNAIPLFFGASIGVCLTAFTASVGAPADAKLLAYTVDRIRGKVPSSEFTAVTDVALLAENERHRFVRETLRDAGVEAVAMEGFAVWTAKLRPMIQ